GEFHVHFGQGRRLVHADAPPPHQLQEGQKGHNPVPAGGSPGKETAKGEPPAGLPQRLQQPAHGQAQVDGPGDQRRCRRRRPPSLDSGQGGRQLVHGQARRRAGGRRGHSGQGQRRPAEMVRLGGGQQLQRRRSFLVPAVLSHPRKQGRLQGGLIFLFRFGFYGPGRQEVP